MVLGKCPFHYKRELCGFALSTHTHTHTHTHTTLDTTTTAECSSDEESAQAKSRRNDADSKAGDRETTTKHQGEMKKTKQNATKIPATFQSDRARVALR